MLRFNTLLLATVSTGKSGGGGPNKRKSKWIDRRYKTAAHGGKDAYPYNAQPVCTLCHMKFKFKQDYLAHTESDIHKDRTRYAETMTWWIKEGKPALRRVQKDEWEWFVAKVAAPEAAKLGLDVDTYIRSSRYRTARMDEGPTFHSAIQPPTAKPEVAEPRDNRWPMSPKW